MTDSNFKNFISFVADTFPDIKDKKLQEACLKEGEMLQTFLLKAIGAKKQVETPDKELSDEQHKLHQNTLDKITTAQDVVDFYYKIAKPIAKPSIIASKKTSMPTPKETEMWNNIFIEVVTNQSNDQNTTNQIPTKNDLSYLTGLFLTNDFISEQFESITRCVHYKDFATMIKYAPEMAINEHEKMRLEAILQLGKNFPHLASDKTKNEAIDLALDFPKEVLTICAMKEKDPNIHIYSTDDLRKKCECPPIQKKATQISSFYFNETYNFMRENIEPLPVLAHNFAPSKPSTPPLRRRSSEFIA